MPPVASAVLEESVGVDVAAVAFPPPVPAVPFGEPDVPPVPLVPLLPVFVTVPAIACVVARAKISGLVQRNAAFIASLSLVFSRETGAQQRLVDWLPMTQFPYVCLTCLCSADLESSSTNCSYRDGRQ